MFARPAGARDVAPDRRDGFGTRDWLIGRRARSPSEADPATGFSPRGAGWRRGPGVSRSRETERDRVWATNVASLYDQATAQQWDASTDIAWDATAGACRTTWSGRSPR